MIHYAVSLLLLKVVLAIRNSTTIDECLPFCQIHTLDDMLPYMPNMCSGNLAVSCLDELTRNKSVNTLESRHEVGSLSVEEQTRHIFELFEQKFVKIYYPLVDDAILYVLKLSIYDRLFNYIPITAYELKVANNTMRGVQSTESPYFLIETPNCKVMDMTVWPVLKASGIGKPAVAHFQPPKWNFRCKREPNGDLCDTLSINSANVTVRDVEPACNTDQPEWRARFDIDDLGNVFQYTGGSIPRCRVLRSISVYVCDCILSCIDENQEECNDDHKSNSAYFSKLTKSGTCDRSNRFCTSFEDPIRFPIMNHLDHFQSGSWISTRPCSVVYFNQTVRNSTLNNIQLIMQNLNYESVYKIMFVMRFTDKYSWSVPMTDHINWMWSAETTYEHYLHTHVYEDECKTNKQSNHEIYLAIGAVILFILVVVATCIVMYNRRSRKKHSKKRRFNESMELREERYHDMIRCPSDDDIFEIDSERVIIFKDQVLGQGAFGKVYKGKIKGLASTSFHAASKLTDDQERAENMLVAVKQCYEFADATTKREFLREIKIMKELYQHDSLVNILHCITHYPHKPFSLILEYCDHGDLLKFLQNSKVYLEELQTDELDNEKIILFDDVAQITFEVADGMAYLSEKGYIHRDIAARNIMVTKGKHVKIGDFGLCRSVVSQDDVYTTKGGRLPIKWMAIESLYDYQFSTKTDVWSYGVLLYELTTLGIQPYADVVPQDGDFRRAMVDHLRSGARLEQPPSCPDEIYAIMKRTWTEKSENRASFAEIREAARRLVESLHDLDGGVYGDRYVGVEVDRCDQQSGGEECT